MSNGKTLHEKMDIVLEKLSTHDVKFEVLAKDISVTRVYVENNSETLKKQDIKLDVVSDKVLVVETEMKELKRKSNLWGGLNSFGIAILTAIQVLWYGKD